MLFKAKNKVKLSAGVNNKVIGMFKIGVYLQIKLNIVSYCLS